MTLAPTEQARRCRCVDMSGGKIAVRHRSGGQAAAASGHPALRLERVSRAYGSGPTAVRALKDVDLEIWLGEFVVMLGPSGSGKTTLLNLVGGIEEPTGGRILMAGEDIGTMNAKERTTYRRDRVGFVFQFFNLVPTLTALENVEIITNSPGRISPGAAGRHSTRLASPTSPTGSRSDVRRSAGAGGDRRAIVKEPPLLLCDEPTGSLEPITVIVVAAAVLIAAALAQLPAFRAIPGWTWPRWCANDHSEAGCVSICLTRAITSSTVLVTE